jgi:hypothetical protein
VAAGKHAAVAPGLGAARKLLPLWRVAWCRGVVHGKSHTAPSCVVHVLRFLGRAQVHLPVSYARRQPHALRLPSRTGARGKRNAPRAARREQTLRRGDRTAAIEHRRHGAHSGPSSWRHGWSRASQFQSRGHGHHLPQQVLAVGRRRSRVERARPVHRC